AGSEGPSTRRPLALARRVARVVRGVRHRPVETVDRTVDASAQIEDLPRLVEIEALDATDATSGALPEAEVTLPGQIGWLRRGRDGRAEVLDLAGGRLPDAALPAEVIVVRGNAPAGWLDLAALVLAAEGLELCVGRPGEVFAARLSRDAVEAPLEVAVRARWTAGARRARRGARTLRWRRAADRLRSRPAAVLGRMLPLGDDAPTPGAWSERLGLRALPAPGGSFDLLPAGAPAAHRRVVSAGHWPHGPRVASDGPRREAILLSTPLNADLARWLSAEIAALERPPVLLSLAREEHAAARSLRDLLPATPWLVPLGRLHPAERAPLAAAILERHDVQRILHVGPGDGVFDHPVLHAALDTRSVRDLAIGVGPLADPTPRPADVIRLQPTTPEHPRLERADAGAIERPFSRRAARHALGLDTEDRVLVGVFDLTAAARPEDFVELLARLALCDPRWRGVLVGRGPLAGTVADLVQLHALGQLLVAPSLDPLLALCAADVVVSTAEHRPLLGALSDAARLGLPIVATDDGSPDHRAEPLPIGSHRVAPGDLDALVAAVTSSAAERAI
ncbi:MAG: hypothetical protein AAGN46_05700, partial [Acidobacteriota bacterium]